MKHKIIYTIIFCLICVSLTACQPTPDKPVVVNKGDNGLEQQIKETASPSASASPSSKNEKWQETIDEGGVHLVIDANIEVPKVSAWPVVKATPQELTIQDVQKAVDTFMKGKTLYEYNRTRSKADVQKDILLVQEKIKEAASDNTIDKSFCKSDLADYQDEYDKAPDQEPAKKKASLEFKTKKSASTGANRSVEIEPDLGNSTQAILTAYTSDDGLYTITGFRKIDNSCYYNLFDPMDTLPGLKISREDAQKTAQGTLNNLGLSDLKLSDTKAGIDMYCIKQSARSAKASDPNRKKCFVFYFSRVVQGIPVTNVAYCNGMSSDDNGGKDEAYDRVWTSENIEIAVDDSGILWFTWESPGDTGDTVNANVKLKDFSDIKAIFKKQMFYQKSWTRPLKKT